MYIISVHPSSKDSFYFLKNLRSAKLGSASSFSSHCFAGCIRHIACLLFDFGWLWSAADLKKVFILLMNLIIFLLKGSFTCITLFLVLGLRSFSLTLMFTLFISAVFCLRVLPIMSFAFSAVSMFFSATDRYPAHKSILSSIYASIFDYDLQEMWYNPAKEKPHDRKPSQ